MKWSGNNSIHEFKVTSFGDEGVSHESQNGHGVAKDQGDHEAAAHRDHRSDMNVKQTSAFHFRSHGHSGQKGRGKRCDNPPMHEAHGQAETKYRLRISRCFPKRIPMLFVTHQLRGRRFVHNHTPREIKSLHVRYGEVRTGRRGECHNSRHPSVRIDQFLGSELGVSTGPVTARIHRTVIAESLRLVFVDSNWSTSLTVRWMNFFLSRRGGWAFARGFGSWPMCSVRTGDARRRISNPRRVRPLRRHQPLEAAPGRSVGVVPSASVRRPRATSPRHLVDRALNTGRPPSTKRPPTTHQRSIGKSSPRDWSSVWSSKFPRKSGEGSDEATVAGGRSRTLRIRKALLNKEKCKDSPPVSRYGSGTYATSFLLGLPFG